MTVDQSQPEAQYYTVVRGDTLSKIAKQYYGDANKYPAIFEANKPMLKSPDLIYPGQMLRIPPLNDGKGSTEQRSMTPASPDRNRCVVRGASSAAAAVTRWR